jgi:hypothetical protein
METRRAITYDATLRRVRVTTVAVEKQCIKYYDVCVFFPECSGAQIVFFSVDHCIITCGPCSFTIFFYIFSLKRHYFQATKLLIIKCVLIFSATCLKYF